MMMTEKKVISDKPKIMLTYGGAPGGPGGISAVAPLFSFLRPEDFCLYKIIMTL